MKLAIDSKIWTEPRFLALTARSGWTREEALGVLVLFWHGTKEAGLVTLADTDIPVYIPVKDVWKARDLLLQCGYLKASGPKKYEVVGNREVMAMVENRRKWAAKGGQAAWSDKKAPAAPNADSIVRGEASPAPALVLASEADKPRKQKPDTEGNRACWESYREAFKQRYNVEPERNAMTNASVATFVKRVGRDVAPEVIRFYLGHSDPVYVRGCHPMNLAAKDAHGLLTQCRKGQVITPQDAINMGRMQSVQSQLSRVSAGDL